MAQEQEGKAKTQQFGILSRYVFHCSACCFPARPATRCAIVSLVSSRRASLPTHRAVRESDAWRRREVAMAAAFSSALR